MRYAVGIPCARVLSCVPAVNSLTSLLRLGRNIGAARYAILRHTMGR